MDQTRILLAMPLILRDIIKTIVTDQPDMEVVGELGENDDLSNAATETRADFVITSLAATSLHPSSARLLEARSRVKVIAIAGDGGQAFLYDLRPRKRPVGELSPDVLVGLIRKNMTPRLRLVEQPRPAREGG